jgi:hypothetical protein
LGRAIFSHPEVSGSGLIHRSVEDRRCALAAAIWRVPLRKRQQPGDRGLRASSDRGTTQGRETRQLAERRLCHHDNVTSLCLDVKSRLATFLEARKHDTGASTMVAQATFSPARAVARSPRHQGTELLQLETALRQAISLLRRRRERTRLRRQARNLCELHDYIGRSGRKPCPRPPMPPSRAARHHFALAAARPDVRASGPFLWFKRPS